MKAYYNEIDPRAAAWLKELIKNKIITDGQVDERSIEDIVPSDLKGFDRCHFFAGIGVWDYALNQAGWGEGQVWTGSCPCQPFSAAGKGTGFADERHLWPAFHHLISVCRPDTIFGEQVASKNGLTWFDLVQTDLEGIDYTTGAADVPAAGFGAPHLRQRLYFMAISPGFRRRGRGHGDTRRHDWEVQVKRRGSLSWLDDSICNEHITNGGQTRKADGVQGDGRSAGFCWGISGTSGDDNLGNAVSEGSQGRVSGGGSDQERETEYRYSGCTSATNGFWAGADWLYCKDEKYRPVESGTFPLAYGVAGRVGLLRGYGNAIVAPVAKAFIEASIEILEDYDKTTNSNR